jgi:uncharacterized protein DUF6116
MNDSANAAGSGVIAGFLGRLRFPQLFAVAAGLFVLDLFIPDLIPFLDEIFLGLLSAMLAAWKTRGLPDSAPAEKNVTPAAEAPRPLPRD